jgi:hypothetical protein
MKPQLFLGLATACSLFLSSQTLMAHSAADAPDGGLRELVAQSAAVAYGKVVDIQYRNSEPTREEPKGVPHTFVTYEIGKVFRGYLPEKITLRVPGGADGSGGAYTETTAPTFARGEADVLFIPGGEPGDCQLVNCVEGRFRVLEDRIYSGFGVPLVGAEKALEFGGKPRFDVNTMEVPRPAFDKVIKQPDAARWIAANQIDSKGLEELRKKYEAEAPAVYRINMNVEGITKADDYSGEAPAAVMKKYREPLITDEFFALIEHFNAELGQPEQRVVPANPKLAFTVKPPVAAAIKEVAITEPKPSDEELKFRGQTENLVRKTAATSPLTVK